MNTQLGLFLIFGGILDASLRKSLLSLDAGSAFPAMLLTSLIAGVGL